MRESRSRTGISVTQIRRWLQLRPVTFWDFFGAGLVRQLSASGIAGSPVSFHFASAALVSPRSIASPV
jgi:hypothetical protein